MVHNPVTKKTDLTHGWITPSMVKHEHDHILLLTIEELFFKNLSHEEQLKGIQVEGLTEYTRQKITFRCHPNYRNEGPWYDYALFAWEQPSTGKHAQAKKTSAPDWNKEVLNNPVLTVKESKTSDMSLIPT